MAKLKTGRHTSALKERRKAIKREAQNTSVKSMLRTLIKKVEAAVAKKDVDLAKGLLKESFEAWDKAARRDIVHKNAAANKKSRLSKLVASIAPAKSK